ncbi:hypothetical protein ACOMHN_037829 [Nucella lapillus]
MSEDNVPTATSGSKPLVYISCGIGPDTVKELSDHCQVKMEADSYFIPRENVISNARGAHALIVYPKDRVDGELLDAVGLQAVRDGVWGTRWDDMLWLMGAEVSGCTVGIVGLGSIGLAVAKRLRAFEPARILYCGHAPKPTAHEVGAEYVSFTDLLQSSDMVIATCSVSADNQQLFNRQAFAAMKPSAIFVNVTRGALVDQEALYEALTSGQIAAAGLDVTTPEPLPPDHPLLQLPNCTVLPHLASATLRTRTHMAQVTMANILAGLKGEPLPSPAP